MRILGVDPGANTGISLGSYGDAAPYSLLDRWQVHHGLDGFLWWIENALDPLHEAEPITEIVVEKFIGNPEEIADLSGVPIEGAIALWARQNGVTVIWQNRTHKGLLVGYPDTAVTKKQRQRVRFDFLASLGLFAAGTENDDSNDAITHSIVSLRARRHIPTLRWLTGKE